MTGTTIESDEAPDSGFGAITGPRRDRLRQQLANLRALTVGDGIRYEVRTEHVVLHSEPHRELRRYGGLSSLLRAREIGRGPVLLIPPLAAPATCYDLGPAHSLVGHLLQTGRVPYVVDYGEIGRADRNMGFEDFIDDIVPQAIDRVLADFGGPAGTEVDVIAWSLGGTVSLLSLAAHPELPVRSITAVGTPLNYALVPPYPVVRTMTAPTKGRAITAVLKLLGGIPAPMVQLAYRATAWERELKKPWFILNNLGETETLARMEVVNRFQRTFPGYPGRLVEQMWERLIYRDELARGVVTLGNRSIDLTSIAVPIQLFGSHRDAIVPWRAAQHGVELFGSSPQVHFTTVETSHLGLIAGPDAVRETWPRIDGFLDALPAPTVS
ncbi:polyhydroxyalkanoate synthase [Williamsia limnetica]|uniref:Polyhydroxyalkanoate synthase n=1 Tax=Williamsia limnetica TaxID=882452 RepID=A0A318RUR5_WILLI|nr:alpha/beta fold hydrolase [Williamsia limnetica]PYE21035.1 polyhydroxyalkanoate synthase [Williamsia limnetica]